MINGQEHSGIIYDRLRSDTRVVDSVDTYDLEKRNITQIEQISLVLEIKNLEVGPAEKSVTQTITFTPEEIFSYINR